MATDACTTLGTCVNSQFMVAIAIVLATVVLALIIGAVVWPIIAASAFSLRQELGARQQPVSFVATDPGNELLPPVVLMGDSIMMGYTIKDPEDTLAGLVYRRYGGRRSVTTIAKNGATVQAFTQFLADEHPDLSLPGATIVISIGGNNVLKCVPVTPDDLRGLMRVLRGIVGPAGRIIVMLPVRIRNLPIFQQRTSSFVVSLMPWDRMQAVEAGVVAAMTEVCINDGLATLLVDLENHIVGPVPRELLGDAIHPNAKGNATIFDSLVSTHAL